LLPLITLFFGLCHQLAPGGLPYQGVYL